MSKIKIYTEEEREARKEIVKDVIKNLSIAEVAVNIFGWTMLQSRDGQRYLKCLEHPSTILDLSKNIVYQNKYTGQTMNVFEFMKEFANISDIEAIDTIIEYYIDRDPERLELYQYNPIENKTYISHGLSLPQPNNHDDIVKSFLIETLRISEKVVEDLKERNMLYEDVDHNCVFISCNANGVEKYGCKIDTNPKIKYQEDCLGSMKKVGYFIESETVTTQLVVTENIIDAISYLSLNSQNKGTHVLGCSGAATMTQTFLYNYETQNILNDIDEIIIITNNDAAGRFAKSSLKNLIQEKQLNIKITDFLYDKDTLCLNDYLRDLREKEDSKLIDSKLEEQVEFEQGG